MMSNAATTSSPEVTISKSFYRRKLPQPPAIAFSSKQGREIFKNCLEAGYMEGFFPLAEQFRTQEEPAYCGLSTLTMVLNALGTDPGRVWKGPWRWFSEEMLNCCTPTDVIKKKGINFRQLACLARCNGAKVQDFYADDADCNIDMFREYVKAATSSGDHHLVISYSRKSLKQSGDGHFSPIGGYDPENDLLLIMDVARFKYPPHWVSLSLIFESMCAIDAATGRSRGFMRLCREGVSSLYFVVSPSRSKYNIDWNRLLERLRVNIHDLSACLISPAPSPVASSQDCEVCNCQTTGSAEHIVSLISTYVIEFGLNYVPNDVKDQVNLLLEQIRSTLLFSRVSQCRLTSGLAQRTLGLEIVSVLMLALGSGLNELSPVPEPLKKIIDTSHLPEPLKNEVAAVRQQIQTLLSFCGGVCEKNPETECSHCDGK